MKLANASTSKAIKENQVRICDYYENGWEYIIRPPKIVANGIAFYAEKLCANNNVIYSQDKRLTLDNFLKCNDYDTSEITKELFCDCSSFVATCINSVGYRINTSTFTTRTMRSVLRGQGFEIYLFNKSILKKGDILLKEGSHTVIVVQADTNLGIKKGIVHLQNKNSYLNVREKPNVTSKVITTLNYGEEVKIDGEFDGWYQITANGYKGYCSKNYVSV